MCFTGVLQCWTSMFSAMSEAAEMMMLVRVMVCDGEGDLRWTVKLASIYGVWSYCFHLFPSPPPPGLAHRFNKCQYLLIIHTAPMNNQWYSQFRVALSASFLPSLTMGRLFTSTSVSVAREGLLFHDKPYPPKTSLCCSGYSTGKNSQHMANDRLKLHY